MKKIIYVAVLSSMVLTAGCGVECKAADKKLIERSPEKSGKWKIQKSEWAFVMKAEASMHGRNLGGDAFGLNE